MKGLLTEARSGTPNLTPTRAFRLFVQGTLVIDLKDFLHQIHNCEGKK